MTHRFSSLLPLSPGSPLRFLFARPFPFPIPPPPPLCAKAIPGAKGAAAAAAAVWRDTYLTDLPSSSCRPEPSPDFYGIIIPGILFAVARSGRHRVVLDVRVRGRVSALPWLTPTASRGAAAAIHTGRWGSSSASPRAAVAASVLRPLRCRCPPPETVLVSGPHRGT
ncbi:hypothetical protein PVAP13_4NG255500 [Panicum virgatum]|uniref:Uncharacterized protein n=1 Tax=Panicum virgatum TaxID=38727 RepID=A0A8T0T960_PANVG|nr:hypothetical protein PVAP13_4NG255500 [Panicum virgatum]